MIKTFRRLTTLTISLFVFTVISARYVEARPLLTEELEPIGQFFFETGFSLSQRNDEFEPANSRFKSVAFPVWFKFGVLRNMDLGLTLESVSQTLTTSGEQFKGSLNSRVSPEIKYVFSKTLGLQFIWHTKKAEKENEKLPVGAGRDFEFNALLKAPTKWPVNVNIGYDLRGKYQSSLGVASVDKASFDPGDIFQCSAALEIPLFAHFSLLTEGAYYDIGESKFNNQSVSSSAGQAADALFGVVWSLSGWNIQGGIGFGLLDERHTSFDYARGAGDTTYRLELSYRLKPSKPQK